MMILYIVVRQMRWQIPRYYINKTQSNTPIQLWNNVCIHSFEWFPLVCGSGVRTTLHLWARKICLESVIHLMKVKYKMLMHKTIIKLALFCVRIVNLIVCIWSLSLSLCLWCSSGRRIFSLFKALFAEAIQWKIKRRRKRGRGEKGAEIMLTEWDVHTIL